MPGFEDETYRCTHTFFTSLQDAKKGHTKSVKMLTLPGTLPVTRTNQGRLQRSSIKSQVCSDASPEQPFSCQQFLLKDLMQENCLDI